MTEATDINVKNRILTILDKLRPAIKDDGGDIEFVDFNDKGVVSIRFQGNCVGCPSSTMTLKMGIERNLKENVPQVTEVIAVL